jgi:CRP-like cAMP-binding protein
MNPAQASGVFQSLARSAASRKEVCDMIAATQLFADAAWNDIENFSGYVQCYETPAGTVIFKEGDAGSYMCLLVNGDIDVLKEDHAGKPQHIASVSHGKTVGEMAIIDGEPRSATCIAHSDSTVLLLTKDNYGRIIKERPGLAVFILTKLAKLMSQRLRGMSGQLVEHLDQEAS